MKLKNLLKKIDSETKVSFTKTGRMPITKTVLCTKNDYSYELYEKYGEDDVCRISAIVEGGEVGILIELY